MRVHVGHRTVGMGQAARAGASAFLVLLVVGLMAIPVLAFEDIVIPIDQVVRGEEGEVHLLRSVPVDPGLVGFGCPVSAVSHNQESVHPDSDLIIDSGGSRLILEDVESESYVEVTAEGTLTLADTIEISVRLGPDGVFSGGLTVTIACGSATTTTTEVSATTATSEPPSTETTSTTEAPPSTTSDV
ncbi:MAG: hypothetical protein Q8Q52_08625, partial [Acidimicrobiia bacterium]|nr:hypothetical protein [Acidimicrobiia bacterium]